MKIEKLLNSKSKEDIRLAFHFLSEMKSKGLIEFFKQYGEEAGDENSYFIRLPEFNTSVWGYGFYIRKGYKYLGFYGNSFYLDSINEKNKSHENDLMPYIFKKDDPRINDWFQ